MNITTRSMSKRTGKKFVALDSENEVSDVLPSEDENNETFRTVPEEPEPPGPVDG